MCQWTSITYLCGLCEVSAVSFELERADCRAVTKGRHCPSAAGPTSQPAFFRQHIGNTHCEPCRAEFLRQRAEGWPRARSPGSAAYTHYYTSGADDDAAELVGRRRWGAVVGTEGDRELRLETQHLWDPRCPPPASDSHSAASSASTTRSSSAAAVSPLERAASLSDNDASRPASRTTDRSGGSAAETQKSEKSNASSSKSQVGRWTGDRRMTLHSERYW